MRATRSTDLSAGELRRMLDAVDPVAHDGPGEFLPDTVLDSLCVLVGCDVLTFQQMDPWRRSAEVQLAGPACLGATSEADSGAEHEAMELFWSGFWDSPFCSYPNRTGDHASVTRLSDFSSRAAMARTPIGRYHELMGITHELMLPLPPDGELDRRVMLFRDDGADFSDRDVLMLRLLRPHLMALHLRQRRRAAGVPDLTARQFQALRLVAEGRTNAQVARALGIAEATVRKHLENAFSRLDVGTRAAAVAKVLPFLTAG